MAEHVKVDICIIGAGSGGLSVAAGAQQMGASTALIEKGLMGGDCLNYGCVPSKALLAAGHAAKAFEHAADFGVNGGKPEISSEKVYGHIRDTIAAIAPNDSVERFEGMGVKVIEAEACFTGPGEVVAGETTVRARRFVIATGSHAFVPPIKGLDQVPYMTNETIFNGPVLPDHLVVIGGGPIGIEMAQAHRHLGCKVTVLEMFAIMPKDDSELVAVVRRALDQDGITIIEGIKVVGVEKTPAGVAVIIEKDGAEETIEGSDLLVAAGRRPNVGSLDLEKAGVEHSPMGITVDARLRTSNKKIFAIGDVAGGFQFTHVAGYHAGIVIRNALFRLPAKADMRATPWVTYTAPELAQVGLTEDEARKKQNDIKVLTWPFAENDRAQAERLTDGLIKVVTNRKGHILGVGIAGAHAGELIQMWVLAMSRKLKIGDVASMIAPYPTLGEVSKRAAGSFYTEALFGPRTKKLIRFLRLFG
ncbi:MAG: FAD-dependent oxidoreductase [Rhodospirillaceae bacterium]|jgi:pyruvate/2-oxoglutarate dehydrogenase complex dihydrolipoamide dehydrogenase (E3) component|nr:FAD-dependent oxidoreductase [Rhodospirillaceae bacterium]MBT5244889.1 FAD-dependent oxidoreductase [Rhodospirillaceae bacterium]MBT5562721.1 FAD-dependent oxidoreductase [Rhodospirillaceae bacterium]MBT6242970.1 FAD-dependent oxidoreductase [Rhodospirillaceae bacterium]MBT7136817.1 FAD-dependent oxidoreductase [Rhodospirillaceae bacterium]